MLLRLLLWLYLRLYLRMFMRLLLRLSHLFTLPLRAHPLVEPVHLEPPTHPSRPGSHSDRAVLLFVAPVVRRFIGLSPYP